MCRTFLSCSGLIKISTEIQFQQAFNRFGQLFQCHSTVKLIEILCAINVPINAPTNEETHNKRERFFFFSTERHGSETFVTSLNLLVRFLRKLCAV